MNIKKGFHKIIQLLMVHEVRMGMFLFKRKYLFQLQPLNLVVRTLLDF